MLHIKIPVLIAVLFSVSACDVESIASAKHPSSSKLSERGSVFYLPGGAGLEFKDAPLSDSEETNANGIKYRLVKYKFSQTPKEVDLAVANILVEDGYTKVIEIDDKKNLYLNYRKAEVTPVYFRYSYEVFEGLVRGASLTIWWVI